MSQKRRIKVYDTTLRDGEQAPGFSMTVEEKCRVAAALSELGVDVIETGFPAASHGEIEAVSRISEQCTNVVCTALARANDSDIDAAKEALSSAQNPRIHVFIPTSDVQIMYQMRSDRSSTIKQATMAVRRALRYVSDVQFSAMDGTRADREFLCQIFSQMIEEGVSTINISDTVGYLLPHEAMDLVRYVKENVAGIDKVELSIHCHDDLGMSTANTIAAVKAGIDQVECTVNGIGERAGNAALEEVVTAMKIRGDELNVYSEIDFKKLLSLSEIVQEVTGVRVPPNKSVVGSNAFAHEAGIHQDGLLKNEDTYQLVSPALVGLKGPQFVLGKHSGRHALLDFIRKKGYSLSENQFKAVYNEIKVITDRDKKISQDEIIAIIEGILK